MNRYLKIFLLIACFSGMRAQAPTAVIAMGSNTICTNVSVTFSAITTNSPTSYFWSVTPSTSVTIYPDNTNSAVAINFGRAGTHSITLVVANGSGTTTAQRFVNVTLSANASFNAQLSNSGYPANLNLTNFSSNSTGNYWIFSDVIDKDSTENTVKTYTASGSYSVMLVALGNNGCNDTLAYDFFINDSSGVTAPTVFTPNNDNANDIFRPVAKGISEMNVWIYNRFGTLVASWDKVNGFWDGYTTSGQPCAAGVYFYVIEATGFDGKSYKIKNNLTLIR